MNPYEGWFAGAFVATIVAGVSLFLWLLVFRVIIPLIQEEKRLLAEKKKGLCAKCGYDLRASPRYCPECGVLVINSNK